MRQTRTVQGGRHPHCGGFTILELLVVIGIIVILVGILIPVVSHVRQSARVADSKNQISVIQNAIERYYGDFQAYPGPLPNDMVGLAPPATLVNVTPQTGGVITGTENLVLGLCGGLYNNAGAITFDPTRCKQSQGPASLNANQPRTYSAYIDGKTLSEGAYKDDAGPAADTNIPEFLDRFSNPLPVLYLRANVGTMGVISATNGTAQYDLNDIMGYTNTLIGVGKTPNTSMYTSGVAPTPIAHGLNAATAGTILSPKGSAGYFYPYDAYAYFQSPNQAGQARAKDGYILISAGADRIYGTEDDITTFGNVVP
jgi:type II secretory pathway pseudopilin PulG